MNRYKKSKHSAAKKKRVVLVFMIFALLAAAPFCINAYIKSSMTDYMIDQEDAATIEADCILVLGAGLKAGGTPNDMLADRLDTGISLYYAGAAPKLLLTGDNGQIEYNEVQAMKEYAEAKGVPAEDIFLDHAGFSTYESMYRARDIFRVKTVLVVTQKYHQYRSLYIARGLGLEAYGVVSEPRSYSGQTYREMREILARNKDFFMVMLQPEPTYLGEEIPITGNGIITQE